MSTSFTHSFSSSDATRVTPEGRYYFELLGGTARFPAVRVSLATLELPLSQLPVEEAWNQIRFAERIRLQPGRHQLTVVERGKMHQLRVAHIVLPVYMNAIASLHITASQGGVVDVCVQTEDPHCLWPEGVGKSYAVCWQRFDPVRIIGTTLGDIAFDPSTLIRVDDVTFSISGGRCSSAASPCLGELPSVGYLHCPSLPGPLQVAELLEFGMRASLPDYHATVDAIDGGIVLCAGEVQAHNPIVSVEGDTLPECIGLGGCVSAQWWSTGVEACSIAGSTAQCGEDGGAPWPSPHRTRPLLVHDGDGGARQSSTSAWAHMLKGGAWNVFGTAHLPTGWYDISTRPVGATERHDFGRSWTQSLSPLYLAPQQEKQLPATGGDGCAILSSKLLHFFDSMGTRCHVTLPMGQLTPQGLASYLTNAMSSVARRGGGASVNVTFDVEPSPHDSGGWNLKGRFVFSLSSGGATGVLPSPPRFSLEFDNSTTTLDPNTLGFAKTTYNGAASYISPQTINVPFPSGKDTTPGTRGVWHANVVGTERRLRFSCEPQPEMLVIVDRGVTPASTKASGATILCARVYTITSGRPWAHGYRKGEVVQLRRRGESDTLPGQLLCPTTEDYTWVDYNTPSTLSSGSDISLIVSDHDVGGYDFSSLWLEVPSQEIYSQLQSHPWILCPPRDIYPSLYLGGDGSLPPEALGFPPASSLSFHATLRQGWRQSALVWGTVGDTRAGWPITSWSIYRLDPPEVVLIYLNDHSGKGRSSLTHHIGGELASPMARLVLGSLHREGGLRSETQMASGEALGTFSIRLTNPDGTPYNMHNASFTFSLQMVCPLQ